MGKRTEIVMDEYIDVLETIKERITQAQYQVMTNANVERNILFWNIGNVILQYSKWGNKFVETLSKDLRMTYPDREGYSVRNLNYMKQFARRIPSEEIFYSIFHSMGFLFCLLWAKQSSIRILDRRGSARRSYTQW